LRAFRLTSWSPGASVAKESIVIRRTRFAYLLPIIVVIALRALSHAHPAPLPWTAGVFDADGLDELLNTIRVPYTQVRDPHPNTSDALGIAIGRVSLSEAAPAGRVVLSSVHSRAPPRP
jgi:hypothetical protein